MNVGEIATVVLDLQKRADAFDRTQHAYGEAAGLRHAADLLTVLKHVKTQIDLYDAALAARQNGDIAMIRAFDSIRTLLA